MTTKSRALVRPSDPAELGFPPTLPIELAMRVAPVQQICAAYDITREEYEALRYDPNFRAAVKKARDMLKEEGMSFKMKARLQAEELLSTSWNLIHSDNDEVPPNVKADLIKFTIRAAGLDGSKDQAASQHNMTGLQININL